jgi:hypothetical protein
VVGKTKGARWFAVKEVEVGNAIDEDSTNSKWVEHHNCTRDCTHVQITCNYPEAPPVSGPSGRKTSARINAQALYGSTGAKELIKPFDEEAARKLMKYVPFWA